MKRSKMIGLGDSLTSIHIALRRSRYRTIKTAVSRTNKPPKIQCQITRIVLNRIDHLANAQRRVRAVDKAASNAERIREPRR